MPNDIRIFVNDRGHTLAAGSSVRDAIRAAVPDLLADAEGGGANITDARGLPVALDEVLTAGTILRAARSSRRAEG